MTTYAHYELELLLSRGGMGEVWLARDTRAAAEADATSPDNAAANAPAGTSPESADSIPPNRVALKIPNLEADAPIEEILRRFAREARTLARLDHTGVPRHIESRPTGEQPFLTMEYVDGVSLFEMAKRAREDGTPLPLPWIGAVARQLAEALAYLHGEAGLIHRDVKPDNILVTDAGRLVLVDFGIALAPGQTRLTRFGRRAGSPRFMAPEQDASPERLTTAVDVYAFGLVLYEMLAGQLPEGRRYKPARKFRPDVSRAWDALLRRCLVPDPARRPPDGGTLLTLLDRVPEAPSVMATTVQPCSQSNIFDQGTGEVSPVESTPEPAPGKEIPSLPKSRVRTDSPGRPWLALFAGAMVVIGMLAGTAAWFWGHGGRTQLSQTTAAETASPPETISIPATPTPRTEPAPSRAIVPPIAPEPERPPHEANFPAVVEMLKRDELDRATRALAAIVKRQPADEGLRVNLALLYLQQDRTEFAEQALREGLRLRPDSQRLRQTIQLVRR